MPNSTDFKKEVKMIKTAKFMLFVAIAMVGFVTVAPVTAAELGLDFSSPPLSQSVVELHNQYSLGYLFQANTNLTVTGLGTFDNGSLTTLPSLQQVGLWDSSGNLLASAFTGGNSTQIGLWAFSSITPITLIAGNDYVVGSQGDAIYGVVGTPVTVNPNITFLSSAFYFQGQIGNTPLHEPVPDYSLTTAFSAGDFGGNIQITGVPEPASLLLVSSSLVCLIGLRRKFKK
jgi:hypothetical protein